MDTKEICTSFKLSQNKRMQISILAELTDTDKETIIEILRDNGLCVRMGRCKVCGKTGEMYLNNVCKDCQMEKSRRAVRENTRKSVIMFQIKQKEQRRRGLMREAKVCKMQIEATNGMRQSKLRQARIVEKEIEKLKEELNGKV